MTEREETTHAYDMPPPEDRTALVRVLNDQLRCHGRGGTLAVTAEVIALGRNALPAILAAVRQFAAFNPGNNQHSEHDFGSIDWRGTRLLWKIDYYDRGLQYS